MNLPPEKDPVLFRLMKNRIILFFGAFYLQNKRGPRKTCCFFLLFPALNRIFLSFFASSSFLFFSSKTHFPFWFCFSGPPQITLRPRNQQVKEGGIAIFYCAASGDPQPELQWRKNGKKLPGTQSRYIVKNFPEVRIEISRSSPRSVGKA